MAPARADRLYRDVAIDAATNAGLFPELVAWFTEVVEAMRSRWQEATLPPPLFPAFS